VVAAAMLVVVDAAVVHGTGRTDGAGLVYALLVLAGEVGFAVLAVPLVRTLGPLLLSGAVCAVGSVWALLLGVLLQGPAALPLPTGGQAAVLAWMALPVTVLAF
jgi:hypothetical protein